MKSKVERATRNGFLFYPLTCRKKAGWLCEEPFSVSSAVLFGEYNPMVFPDGTLMKTNTDVISFVLRVLFNSK